MSEHQQARYPRSHIRKPTSAHQAALVTGGFVGLLATEKTTADAPSSARKR
jgi:hypothetical protein